MRARRDPFARLTARGIPVHPTLPFEVCSWCGQLARPRHPLRRIIIEHDGGRTDRLRGEFDSWACAEAYHDQRIGR